MDVVEFLRHVPNPWPATRSIAAGWRRAVCARRSERPPDSPRSSVAIPQAAHRAPPARSAACTGQGGPSGRSHRPPSSGPPRVALSDCRATAVELRGAPRPWTPPSSSPLLPVATPRRPATSPPSSPQASVRHALVDRVTDNLLRLDPAPRHVSRLTDRTVHAAPLSLLTRLRVHAFRLGVATSPGRATLNELRQASLTEVQVAASTVQNATSTPTAPRSWPRPSRHLHHQGVIVVGAACDSQGRMAAVLELGVEKRRWRTCVTIRPLFGTRRALRAARRRPVRDHGAAGPNRGRAHPSEQGGGWGGDRVTFLRLAPNAPELERPHRIVRCTRPPATERYPPLLRPYPAIIQATARAARDYDRPSGTASAPWRSGREVTGRRRSLQELLRAPTSRRASSPAPRPPRSSDSLSHFRGDVSKTGGERACHSAYHRPEGHDHGRDQRFTALVDIPHRRRSAVLTPSAPTVSWCPDADARPPA